MAKVVLEKEQLDTNEKSNNEQNNSNSINESVSKFEEKKQNNIVDDASRTDTSTVNDIPIEEDTSSTHSFRRYIPLICVLVAIIIFILLFSTVFALTNKNNTKIIEGVYVNGINLSGLSSEEASKKLSDTFSKKLTSTITLSYGEYEAELIPSEDIDANYNISLAVDKAYSIGRSGNLIQNNYDILLATLSPKMVTINLQYNIEKLDKYVDDISVELPGLVQHPSYYTEGSNLIILRGNSGIELLQDKTKELILSNIDSLSTSTSIEMPTQNIEPNQIDIDKIHEEIYSEPENAYIVKEPFELNVGKSGTDFGISIEEAKNLIAEEKEEYVIPLKITPPEIRVEDLGNDIFVHTLGTYSSTYKVSNYNRTVNVELATKKINNVILLPGEEFSYNKVVGERTFANGFREASVYTSSGVVNGLGGGICQVSSTLYNSVLLANLEIVERRNHRYAVSYVPLGRDATVSYGSIDFRFKNNRKYPIKIVASSQNGKCNISIMGIKEDVEYEVSITTKMLQKIQFKTNYIQDSSMAVGTQKQTQYGDYGYKYETYKTLLLNGNVVSSEKISNDSYVPLTRVVRVGAKQAQPVTPPAQTPTPEQPQTSEPPTTPTPTPSTDNNNNTNNNATENNNSSSTNPTGT